MTVRGRGGNPAELRQGAAVQTGYEQSRSESKSAYAVEHLVGPSDEITFSNSLADRSQKCVI